MLLLVVVDVVAVVIDALIMSYLAFINPDMCINIHTIKLYFRMKLH
jgi:hypothetical protein